MQKQNLGYFYALLAAILFGASVPAAKFLMGGINPWLLAGLLYLGSSIGSIIIFSTQRFLKKASLEQACLQGSDWKWLAGSVFFGGTLAPVFLMFGLSYTLAASASLFLNLESVFTALMAWIIFKEHVDRKIAFGMLCIVIGGLVLSWNGTIDTKNFVGPLLLSGACLCWALDNNLTRKISAANPVQIAMIKAFVAGSINTMLALSFGAHFPSTIILFSAGLVGLFSYGFSLILFILALRHIGTARTGAYFSLAPFVGVGLSIVFLGEHFSAQLIIASIFMAVGIWLHLAEKHSHEHHHEFMEHDHRHVHDEHHQHEHGPQDPVGEPHSHPHRHEPMTHTHPHYPDIHHRHGH